MDPNVLIADGDAELRGLYWRFFKEHGYAVETSSDGLDCIRKLPEVRPAVLVLDLGLRWGGSDGVLAWLREENPEPRPAVILTAPARCPQDLAQFIEAPVVACLPKPFTLSTLLESVRSALARRERMEPSNLNRAPACPELFFG